MKIAITGANGFIGSALSSQAIRAKCNVLALTRTPPVEANSSWQRYDIADGANLKLPDDVQVVVHLAATTKSSNFDIKREIWAARKLISASSSVGAKFIFVSSQVARFDAPTLYGRCKWQIEQDVLAAGGEIIRPGMVYGGAALGLFSILVGVVKRSPLLPKFIPEPLIQTIHVDDLSQCILKIAQSKNNAAKIFHLAENNPIKFSDYLNEIAKTRVRTFRLFIPVPINLFRFIYKNINILSHHNFGLERLESLFDLPLMRTKTDLESVGIQLRPLSSGMHRSGSVDKRLILIEGYAVLSYILRCDPTSSLVREYCRAIFLLRSGKPLCLSKIFIKWPILLSIVEKNCFADSAFVNEFDQRLNIATPLAEFTISGAKNFLELKPSFGVIGALWNIVIFLFLGLLWRILGAVLSPLVRFQRFHGFKLNEA